MNKLEKTLELLRKHIKNIDNFMEIWTYPYESLHFWDEEEEYLSYIEQILKEHKINYDICYREFGSNSEIMSDDITMRPEFPYSIILSGESNNAKN